MVADDRLSAYANIHRAKGRAGYLHHGRSTNILINRVVPFWPKPLAPDFSIPFLNAPQQTYPPAKNGAK